MAKCLHKRVKKNYPFGRKSRSVKFCKDCGKVLTNKHYEEIRMKREKLKRRFIKELI